MNAADFRIMSQVYRLLGEHTAAELEHVANQENEGSVIREALECLAREARRMEPSRRREKTSRTRNTRPTRTSPKMKSEHPSIYKERVVGFLSDPNQFPSKPDMIRFVEQAGLAISANSKSSRAAVARKVVSQTEKNPDDRKKLLRAIQRAGNGETKGWLALISERG